MVEDNDTVADSDVVIVGNVADFDWKSATLLDLENENKVAIDKLAWTGINADAL